MAVLVLERVKIVRFFCGVFLVLMIIWGISRWPEAGRSLYGVKDRVTLEGLSVERLLPHELQALVEVGEKDACSRRKMPGFPGDRGVVPEKWVWGWTWKARWKNVLRAQPGEALSLVTYSIPATVTKDFFTPVYKGDTSGKKASITINVAWGEEEIPAMLSILREHGVKATFFFVGDWVRKFPDLVREIHREGHEVANHGLYHGHPNKMSRAELRELILENTRLLEEVTGAPPAKLFAPPYGEFNTRCWPSPEPGLPDDPLDHRYRRLEAAGAGGHHPAGAREDRTGSHHPYAPHRTDRGGAGCDHQEPEGTGLHPSPCRQIVAGRIGFACRRRKKQKRWRFPFPLFITLF